MWCPLTCRVPDIDRWRREGEVDDADNEVLMGEAKGRSIMITQVATGETVVLLAPPLDPS